MRNFLQICLFFIILFLQVRVIDADKPKSIPLHYENNNFKYIVLYDLQSQVQIGLVTKTKADDRYRRIVKYISWFSKKYDVNPLIPACIFRTESDYRNVTGDDGTSFGVAQLSLGTIALYSDKFRPYMAKNNIQTNIAEAIYHIAYLVKYGELPKIIVAYNAGEGYISGKSLKVLKKKAYYKKVMYCINTGRFL